LRAAREAKGLAVNGLAAVLKCDRQAIYRIERDVDGLGAERAERLAAALGVTPEYLLFGTGGSEPPKMIAVIASIPAAFGRVAYEEELGETRTHKAADFQPGAFALLVDGDSMSPLIPHHSIVICEPLRFRLQGPPENAPLDSRLPVGKIVVAHNIESDEDTIKYLSRAGKRLYLEPLCRGLDSIRFNDRWQITAVARALEYPL
jgi:transcriptional regulator with XRE-family HTH domain